MSRLRRRDISSRSILVWACSFTIGQIKISLKLSLSPLLCRCTFPYIQQVRILNGIFEFDTMSGVRCWSIHLSIYLSIHKMPIHVQVISQNYGMIHVQISSGHQYWNLGLPHIHEQHQCSNVIIIHGLPDNWDHGTSKSHNS